MNEQLGQVSNGNIAMSEALNNLQEQVVRYAKDQGFKVKE
jgi:hypothetical protein